MIPALRDWWAKRRLDFWRWVVHLLRLLAYNAQRAEWRACDRLDRAFGDFCALSRRK